MTMMKIGLLEDRKDVAEALMRILGEAGHHCTLFANGASFRRHLETHLVDILILNWTVPDASGLELLQWTRDRHITAPTLMLTARSDPEDILAAFRAGAADCIVKPVEPNVLITRIHALARQVLDRRSDSAVEAYGTVRFEPARSALVVNGRRAELTEKEYLLALILFRHHGRTLSRAYIYRMVWGNRADNDTRTLDVHISKLRSKAHIAPENGCRLRPVYGQGYRLELLSEDVSRAHQRMPTPQDWSNYRAERL